MNKSPALKALLDSVPVTGKTLHPTCGAFSLPVYHAAQLFGQNAQELQAEVTAWARYCDSGEYQPEVTKLDQRLSLVEQFGTNQADHATRISNLEDEVYDLRTAVNSILNAD